MRTQEEIVSRFNAKAKADILLFEVGEYLHAMTRESAEQVKEHLKDDVDFTTWEQGYKTDEDLKRTCIDYMDFAWEKAKDCRGISAGRSMAHYVAWLWMLGEDQFENIEDYEHYGKAELVWICEFLGLDSTKYDDGIRVNSEEELY